MANGKKERPPAPKKEELKASLQDATLYSDAHLEICQAAGIPIDPKHGAPVSAVRHLVESWKSTFTGINIIVNRFRLEIDRLKKDHDAAKNRWDAERDRMIKRHEQQTDEIQKLKDALVVEDRENLQHRVTDHFRSESMLAAPVTAKVLEELGSDKVLEPSN